MSRIRLGRKIVVGKQKISSNYHQLAEKCDSLHFSVSYVVQLVH